MKPEEIQENLPQQQSRASRDGETPVPGAQDPWGTYRVPWRGPSLLPARSLVRARAGSAGGIGQAGPGWATHRGSAGPGEGGGLADGPGASAR